ncbi:MAG: M48 family metallopeptidase [Methylophilaceae bacterium]|nr:M48 family metallopeptidase [Methylophilaceae bacterium]
MSAYCLLLPDGSRIPYRLELRPRKTIGMRISVEGLIVHAPQRISQSQLEQILLSKINWIQRKLETRQERVIETMQWRDGANLLLLGNTIKLSVKQHNHSRAIAYRAGVLQVALPGVEDELAIARKVLQWYQKQALTDFGRRIELLAAKLDVPTPKLFISNARTRWGSCNSKNEIRLSWRLLQAPPHIINYVTAHELAHLKEMNHSVKFWTVVERIFPDYRNAEQELKSLAKKLYVIG